MSNLNIFITVPVVLVIVLAQSSNPKTFINYMGPMIGNSNDASQISALLDPSFTFTLCNGTTYDNVGSVNTLTSLHVPDANYKLQNSQNVGNGNQVNMTIEVKMAFIKVGSMELTAEPSTANPSGYILLSGNQVC